MKEALLSFVLSCIVNCAGSDLFKEAIQALAAVCIQLLYYVVTGTLLAVQIRAVIVGISPRLSTLIECFKLRIGCFSS